MDTRSTIERWRKVTAALDAETASPKWWKDAPAPHFLHAFRPEGTRLGDLFDGMTEMAPVLERLRVIFERAGPETGHMYFIVSRPRRMDDEELVRCVREWLRSVASMAKSLGLPGDSDNEEMRFLSSENPTVKITRAPLSRNPGNCHPVETAVYEIVTEFGRNMTRENEVASLLEEPLYQIACSYELAYWVLSPLAPEASHDPFAPAAALWEADVSLEFKGRGKALHAVAHREA